MVGDPHITTYDGRPYNLHLKRCSYVLSEHCHLPGGAQGQFTVEIRNRYCSRSFASCRREVLIRVSGEPSIILDIDDMTKKPAASIESWGVLGSTTSITTDYSTEKINVEFLGDRNIFVHVHMQNGVAFTVQWTGYNTFMTVSESLFNHTCGLCGTFNDNEDDDFHMRSGDNELSIDEFAKQWLVRDKSDAECVNYLEANAVDYCVLYQQNLHWAQEKCKVIKQMDGPFADCHARIPYHDYYSKCQQDGCRCEECLCNVMAGYAKACADKGIDVDGWRSKVHVCSNGKFITMT